MASVFTWKWQSWKNADGEAISDERKRSLPPSQGLSWHLSERHQPQWNSHGPQEKSTPSPVLPSLICLKRWTGQFGQHFIARFTKSSLKASANDNQHSGFVLFLARTICVAGISSYSNVPSSSSTSWVLLDEYWKGNSTPQLPKKMWRSADCLSNLSPWGTTSSQPQQPTVPLRNHSSPSTTPEFTTSNSAFWSKSIITTWQWK